MTEQFSERLDNQCWDVVLGDLDLEAIAVGDIASGDGWGTEYPFQNKPSDIGVDSCTALYRGYIAEFELTNAGELFLKGYDYPYVSPKVHTDHWEQIEGDFWMVMDSEFAGPRVYIPFRGGRIIRDESQWITEGAFSVDSIRYPERVVWTWFNLERPVLLGTVKSVETDRYEPERVRFVSDREFEREFYYCQVRFIRSGQVICELRIDGNSGDGSGPWTICPSEVEIRTGDELWATAVQRGKRIAEGVPR